MCKLFAIVEIESRKNAETFARKAVKFVTEDDDDGLGIMRLGENGVHIQRWVEVPKILSMRSTLDRYANVLERNENTEGQRSRELYAIAIHGRYATCAVNIENTHPFYRSGTALMHNGVISNHHEFDKPLSTCDSESLLTRYIDSDVKKRTKNLTSAMAPVQGYFASIVFNDNGLIDIWRDDKASLYMAHVKGVGVVISTTDDIILETAKACKAVVTAISKIKPYTVIRWMDKGHHPIIRRFQHENKPTPIVETEPRNYGSPYFDEMRDHYEQQQIEASGLRRPYQKEFNGIGMASTDALPMDEIDKEHLSLFEEDYAIAKLRGYKGTIEEYVREVGSML